MTGIWGDGWYRLESSGLIFEREWDGVERGPTWTPGFVDLHIHGGFGIDVMNATTNDLRTLDAELGNLGYEGWLATTVTCSAEDALRVLHALPPEDDTGILGLHLEGPFLSPRHPGAQPAHFLAEYTGVGTAWDPVLDHPRLRLVTLAPEISGGAELIRRLVGRGVIVSLGHTDATSVQASAAFEAGARHATHTFNAMRPFHHREAGIVGYVLTHPHPRCELIYDRKHVSPEAARLLFDCKTTDGILAVSDGTMATGLAPGASLKMWGLDCTVGDGDVRLTRNGELAGSAITLLDAFRNLVNDFGWDRATAACALNPRAALELSAPKKWLRFSPDMTSFETIHL